MNHQVRQTITKITQQDRKPVDEATHTDRHTQTDAPPHAAAHCLTLLFTVTYTDVDDVDVDV